jgi:hypothetical protein
MESIMTNFYLYSQPYLANGILVKPEILIQSNQPYEHYRNYYYGTVNVSKSAMPLAKRTAHDKSSAEEWLTRARRTVLFSDTTNLTPMKFNRAEYGGISDRSRNAIHCDHMSFWASRSGAKFILNEPYLDDPDYLRKLRAQGLAGVIIPTDLSPYCGGWNENLGSNPGTTTYLICDLADASELQCLFGKLDLSAIPAWNCVKDINHVQY